jgi:hypothetical protein
MSNIFLNAEQRCFDYLEKKIKGIGGNVGLWPRKTDEVETGREDDLAEWYFAITGGGDNVAPMIAASESKHAVAVSGEVKGRFADRKTALVFAGILWDSLPAAFDNVAEFTAQENALPFVEPTLLTVGETGYEVNGWAVDLPVLVVIGKVDEPDIAHLEQLQWGLGR